MLPNKWRIETLEEIGIASNASIIPSRFPEETFELWSVPNFDLDRPEYLKGKEIGSNKCLVEEGDVLLCKINPRINRVWKVRKKEKYRQIASTEWIVIRSETVNSNFLAYQLSSHGIRTEILKDVSGVGGSLMRARPNAVRSLKIVIPPLNDQQAIVSKIEELFSELDKGIENLRLAQQQLKTYRQAVLNRLIEQVDMQPIESIIDKLDQGWSPKCENQSSSDINEWAVIKTSSIQHGRFLEFENKRLPKHLKPRQQHEIEVGDILITRAGPRVRVGVCCMVKTVRPKLINCDKVYRIKVNRSKIMPEFLELILNAPRYLDEIERMKTGISDSGLNLTQVAFLRIEIPVPSMEKQQSIVQTVEDLLSIADRHEESITQSLQQAEALRQSILKQAFEGKLV